ncbi:MAG: T9SS type A sorting domain-containing protein, partial [Bacteroidia bacterium]
GTYSGTIQNTGLLQGDQSNLGSSTEATAVNTVSQVFVPGGSGELASVLVGFGPTSSSGNLVLTVYADSTSQRPVYSQPFAYNAGTTSAFNLSAPVRIKANRYYRVQLSSGTAFKPMVNNAYATGYSSIAGQDLKFATSIQYASSCPSSDTVVVNYLPAPSAPYEPDTLRCGPGSVSITVVPGSGASNVRWYADSTTTTVLFTGTVFTTPVLSSTTSYFVSSLTTGGCESLSRDRVRVSIAPQPSLTSTTTAVACFGGSTGAVDLSVSSGTPAFTYLWSNGATTQDLSAVMAGTYSVTLHDAQGCTANHSATVSQPTSGITSTATVTHVSCNGQQDGAVDLTVLGGTSPYTYLWSNGATTQDIALLGPGTYTVTITDAHLCTATRTATVNTPSAIALSVTSQNPACAGQNTGSIDLTVSGGTGGYTYLWSNGATSQDLNGLAQGNFTVTVSDASGCTSTTSASIVAPAALTLSISSQPVQCNGGNSGSAIATVGGGTPSYTYQWSTGATTASVSGLVAGSYFLTVTDQAGCSTQSNTTVTEPTPIVLSVTTTQSTCGNSNGTATVAATGGAGGYSYNWPFTGATTPTSGGFPAGNYTVIVTDANGCMDSTLAAVSDFGAPILTLDSVHNVHCNGGSDGEIYTSVTGGVAPITFQWSNGATTEDVMALPAGLYGLTVTDASSCVAALSASITEPTALDVNLVGQDPACAGNPTGSIQSFVLGAVAPYSYAWSNGATTPSTNGILAGIYTLTVTDAVGCTASKSDTLIDPPGMATSVVATDPSCDGLSDGGADLTVTGGTPPYAYQWSMGQVSEDPSGLGAGTYYVTVSDQSGCSRVDSVSLVAPAALTATAVVSNVSCYGQGTGAIDVTTAGGTLPYTYLWANGDTLEDLAALTPGIYGLTVTDAHGCATSLQDSVSEPALLEVMDSVVHIACGGGLTGELHLTVQGGTPSYNVAWSNGGTTLDLIGLAAGPYAATVSDANGCTATVSDTILEPTAIVIADTVQGVTCLGQQDGAIFLTVSGGVPAFTYAWSNGAQTPEVYGLTTGEYTVTVTDARGCAMIDTIQVEGGDSALQAILIAASYVDAEDTLFLYELSEPTPTEVFWDFGDGDTSTARYPVHIYARNLTEDTTAYEVKLVVRNSWCVDSVTQTVYVNNNVQKTNEGPVIDPNAFFLDGTVFPNPNNGSFTLRLNLSNINDVDVALYDMAGRKLIARRLSGDAHYETSFHLTDVSHGVYLISATSGKHVQVYRVAIF